jgi:uncharacterized protein
LPTSPPDGALLRVVSDTTPISELAKVGRLELLRAVYGVILIPSEVSDELAAGDHPDTTAVRSADWIQVRPVSDPGAVHALHSVTRLGMGECGAILLAEELGADHLLIDDRTARRLAIERGRAVGGTIGTVILARKQGLIPSVKQVLDELVARGTRISPRLYRDALAAAGE